MDEADTPLLSRTELLGDHLLVAARPDIVYRSGVPRFVEFNIDGALGGTLQADLLAARFRDLYRPLPGGDRIDAPPSAVDSRFAEIRTSLGLSEGSRVAIPVFSKGAAPGLEDPDAFLAWLAPMCESGRRHGMDTVACPMDRLETGEEDVLLLDGQRVDAVFRLFLSFDQPPSAAWTPWSAPCGPAGCGCTRPRRPGCSATRPRWPGSGRTRTRCPRTTSG